VTLKCESKYTHTASPDTCVQACTRSCTAPLQQHWPWRSCPFWPFASLATLPPPPPPPAAPGQPPKSPPRLPQACAHAPAPEPSRPGAMLLYLPPHSTARKHTMCAFLHTNKSRTRASRSVVRGRDLGGLFARLFVPLLHFFTCYGFFLTKNKIRAFS